MGSAEPVMPCQWCGAELYDRIIRIDGDPLDHGRCADCWNDVTRPFYTSWVPKDHVMTAASIGYTYGTLGRDFAQVLPELKRLEEGI